MEIAFLEGFIKPESMIMIPVLYLIGLFMDRTPNVPPWVTPWVQVFVGVAFCTAYYGMIIQAPVQGILVAGAAVLVKDLIHKPFEKNKNKEENKYKNNQL